MPLNIVININGDVSLPGYGHEVISYLPWTGAVQEQSQRASDANPFSILPRPRYLHGGEHY